MSNENVAEFLQKPLQEAFDAECRSYEIYLKTYESLFETFEKLEKQRNELEEKQELDEKVSDYNQIFNSSEFDKIKKLVNLSDSVVRDFINAFSMYEGRTDLEGKMQDIEYEIDRVSKLFKVFRERLWAIQTNVEYILNYVYDANVELDFSGKNPIAERFLIFYYKDKNNFKYRRNIIKIEGCKLGKNFLKAYLAAGCEEERKAYEWILGKVTKYEI